MERSIESYLVESLVVLLAVAGLAALLLYLARRFGAGPSAGPVALLARLPLEARRCLYVVRVVDRVLILGASEAGLAKLGELPEGAVASLSSQPAAVGFASLLERARGGRFSTRPASDAASSTAEGGAAGGSDS